MDQHNKTDINDHDKQVLKYVLSNKRKVFAGHLQNMWKACSGILYGFQEEC